MSNCYHQTNNATNFIKKLKLNHTKNKTETQESLERHETTEGNLLFPSVNVIYEEAKNIDINIS